jgi:membrane protease YdiL (CAAX protease family)
LVPGERLTKSDKRGLLLWIALGIAGVLFAQKYYFRAFPEASVNFQVSRNEALSRAKTFVATLGQNVDGYQSTAVFSLDDHAKIYLERTVGLQNANALMSHTLNIWYWEIRFFKPQQVEEFDVRVSPSGEIVGYDHRIEESRTGANLEGPAAQTVAATFLNKNLGVNLADWDFLAEEANSTKKPARVDWSFTWEKRGFRAQDAPYRFTVVVHGDRAGAAEQFLKVPEAWSRSFQQTRSANDFMTLVALIPYLLLLSASIWLGTALSRRGQTSWKLALQIGVFVAVLLFFMQLNSWPIERAGYDTNTSYGSFILLQIVKALAFGITSVMTISLVLPGGEPLYRSFLPGKLRLTQALTLRGLRSKEFFSSAVVGISMAAFHIGYVVAFYVIATHFGAWAPQEVNYENSVNTAFPWIAGVAIGFLASTNEEFTFRLFAIPFFHRLTGSRFLAVLIPAFCWSFLHSNYPQEPFYIRGIEIGLIGIVAGLVMLRWGILATLIWHYTVDASLVGLFLLRSHSLYFKISGVVVGLAAVAPLLFAAISYLSRGEFEADEDLLNRAEPAPPIEFLSPEHAAEQQTSQRQYKELSPAILGILVLCLAVGGLMLWRGKPSYIGDYLRLSVDAKSTKMRADEILRIRGIDPGSYRAAAVLVDTTDPYANEFLSRQLGIAGTNAVYEKLVPGALWRVRYFRDRQPEEFGVILRPDGSLHSVRHTLGEDAPGDSLAKDAAVARAEQFLVDEKKIELTKWTLVDSSSEKRPHRVDHTLTWQQNAPLATLAGYPADAAHSAYARIELDVLGGEVANYRTYIKVPDDWRTKQKELTLPRAIFGYAFPGLFIVGAIVLLGVPFFMNFRSEAARSIPWRRVATWSIWPIAAYLLIFAFGNRIALFLNAYQTQIPYKTFVATFGIGVFLGLPFYFGAFALIFGVAWFYGATAFGQDRLPGWTGMPANYYRDAFFVGVGGSTLSVGLQHLSTKASSHGESLHRVLSSNFGAFFDTRLPAAAMAGSALLQGLLAAGLFALIGCFVAARVNQMWQRVLLVLFCALSFVGSDRVGLAGLLKDLFGAAVGVLVIALAIRYVLRLNLLSYFLVAAGSMLLGNAARFLQQPDNFFRLNGLATLAVLILLFSWPLVAWRTSSVQNPN